MPKMLLLVADVAGRDAAVGLARDFGGTHLYIPRTMPPDHPIARAVGHAAAAKLAAYFNGETILVPLGPTSRSMKTRERITALLAKGVPIHDIARTVGVHHRTVRRQRHRLRKREA